MVPQDLRYSSQHEWIRMEDGVATVGITEHAQEALGDITFVELPAEGADLLQGGEACAIESCKAAATIYAPVAGKVVARNEDLDADPGLVNSDPYGKGWVYRIQVADVDALASLMTADQYETFLAEEDGN